MTKAYITARDDQSPNEREVRLRNATVDMYFTARFADFKFAHNGRALSAKRRDIILRAFPDILAYVDAANFADAEIRRREAARNPFDNIPLVVGGKVIRHGY